MNNEPNPAPRIYVHDDEQYLSFGWEGGNDSLVPLAGLGHGDHATVIAVARAIRTALANPAPSPAHTEERPIEYEIGAIVAEVLMLRSTIDPADDERRLVREKLQAIAERVARMLPKEKP